MPSGLVDDLEQHLADWSVCRPIHRRRSQLAQQQPQHQRAKAFHAVAGDYPALWTFSQAPTTTRRATTPAPPSSPSPAVTMDDRRSSPVRRLSSPQQLSPLSLPITKRLPPTPVATGGARSPASSASQRQQQQQEQAETLMAVEFVVVLQYEVVIVCDCMDGWMNGCVGSSSWLCAIRHG